MTIFCSNLHNIHARKGNPRKNTNNNTFLIKKLYFTRQLLRINWIFLSKHITHISSSGVFSFSTNFILSSSDSCGDCGSPLNLILELMT